LHGGTKGFNRKVWDATEFSTADSVGVVLTYLSADMEEGYPGNLNTKVTYVFNNANELKIYYEAETDKSTVINLTNHAYFNLSACKESILGHELTLYGDSITPVDSTLIPLGILATVKGTGFDFTQPHKIGERIDSIPGGYDHNFKLNRTEGGLFLAAEVYEPVSGRLLQTLTTEPGIQFYSGNFLDGTITGAGGIVYQKHFGLCLESQHYPNSPNQPNFPSTVLNPGEKYSQLTIYKFSVK
jgi:aldose 1-epimerase